MQKIMKLYKQYEESILYLFFGGATFVVSVVTYALFSAALHWEYTLAYVASWFLAVLFAYLTNRIWVFRSKVTDMAGVFREVWQFYLARIVTGVLGWLILAFGVRILHQNDLLWNGIQNIFVILANYVLSKLYIFKEKV
ncbi:Putative flippase GtrA (transmembrane translocase of bactoprenol-linked glucose) (GtrA) [Fructobacillus fructosus]|uniref:Flippase GtrA (Transmembrane translocase of bactoprenol-linked glucose) (GtrA) n=2 Tax=Fructobacillus fructosus TaxID=1631 RepID=A0ABM9MXZ5_9LACO|nr:GtrA family protein [Fructobacillus fructosus]KRN51872.1 teichoic acid glycosylation protein [Fructobacillus fructosus KCTC 3544]CAK1224333.1 Putative flippase GtrA (transmembrane translocase of bactoprenol-linked glucose) (GtrA) [Fructobacillus fructosus]CAK1224470.1 Putative flippase GtrA (transmembrane translocase of bactoprenol-linked glucose) (GtrA) [Fructobacillus fructosus]CAK1224669.1 Putative flippase GtrA (transmembrane translocase of bactoprenol-linked glucose) (GtrA) [Fructobacil